MSVTFPISVRALANGLRVHVVENRAVPTVAVNLWYNVGSRNERQGKTGFAHLFEHVMFQGSKNVATNEHMALMDAVGADINATTSFDRTNYFEAVPTGALELALWLEADRMSTLLSALSQENLDNQRDVVRNERRERMDNQPYGTGYEHLFRMAFPEGHPYHHMPIGSMEDLAAASLEDVQEFFTTYYHPGNAVLTLVGDVDTETGFALAERFFGWIPSQPSTPAAPDGAIGPMTQAVRLELREEVPAEAYYSMYRAAVEGSVECDALEVAGAILAGADSSRLTKRLVRDDQVAQQVYGGMNRLIGGVSAFVLMGQIRAGASLGDFEKSLLEEVALLATTGPTEEELEVAKATLERHFLDETATCSGLADLVSATATLLGDPNHLNQTVDRINAVTAEQVRDAVATWLQPENRAVVTYHLDAEDSIPADTTVTGSAA